MTEEKQHSLDPESMAKLLGFPSSAEVINFIQNRPKLGVIEVPVLKQAPTPVVKPKSYTEAYLKNIDSLRELFKTKNSDYGHATLISYYMFGEVGLLTRLWDKLLRLTTINAKGVALVPEKVADTLNDLSNYALINKSILDTFPDRNDPALELEVIRAFAAMRTNLEEEISNEYDEEYLEYDEEYLEEDTPTTPDGE